MEDKTRILVVGESQKEIVARVILIKAKILFIEPNQQTRELLNIHFSKLSTRGECYQIFFADSLSSCSPDIIAVNTVHYKENKIFNNFNADSCPKEVILYQINNFLSMEETELDKLTKAVQKACLKNGLIEIKWYTLETLRLEKGY